MEQMGIMHMWGAADLVAKFVFVVVLIMFIGTVWFIATASMRNFSIRSRAHKVIETFWQTTNPQEAIRAMEAQPASDRLSARKAPAASFPVEVRMEETTVILVLPAQCMGTFWHVFAEWQMNLQRQFQGVGLPYRCRGKP